MIRVDVRLFTILRHRADGQIRDRFSLEVPAGATVADILRELDVPADLPIVISVNDEQADPSAALNDGDQIELIPAVAGGDSPVVSTLSVSRNLARFVSSGSYVPSSDLHIGRLLARM